MGAHATRSIEPLNTYRRSREGHLSILEHLKVTMKLPYRTPATPDRGIRPLIMPQRSHPP